MGSATLRRNGEDVTLVGKRDGLPVGGNGAEAHPQRIGLRTGSDGHQHSDHQGQFSCDIHIWKQI